MDPQNDLPDLVEDLEVNIDELSETLAPLLNTQLSTTASSLPLLDKSKLYVLAAYSIESLLYSTLQASGVNAKEHAVFKELGRLKGYFAKIKEVEQRAQAPTAPKARLDVGAAARFIKHGLAGNEKYDLERAERMAKERARAALKAAKINKKFDDSGAEKSETTTPKKRGVDAADLEEDTEHDNEPNEAETEHTTATEPATKKPRLLDTQTMDVDDTAQPSPSTRKKEKKRGKKKNKSNASSSPEADVDAESASQDTPEEATKPKRKARGKKGKASADEADDTVLPSRALRTRGEAKGQGDEEAPEKGKKGRGRPKKAK